MIRFGVCAVPFGNPAFDHRWLQPKPTVASWRALRSIGITDVRLQFKVGGDETDHEAPVSPRPGVWDTSLFRAFIVPAFEAGMRINANYVLGRVLAHHDTNFHGDAAARLYQEFGHMIDTWSFGNEPGADAQAYEEAHPGSDYMQDVYLRPFLAFATAIRRSNRSAWIIGCDADSADIQKRFTDMIDQLGGVDSNVCDEEACHPYAEVGGDPAHGNLGVGQDYSSLNGMNGKPGFLTVRTPHRPWGITEINAEEPERLFAFAKRLFANPQGCQRFYFLFEGNEGEFFEPMRNADGKTVYSSFYAPRPVISESGRAYAEVFASVNGAVKMTIPGRRPGKGRR